MITYASDFLFGVSASFDNICTSVFIVQLH